VSHSLSRLQIAGLAVLPVIPVNLNSSLPIILGRIVIVSGSLCTVSVNVVEIFNLSDF
jgi:hypothetical protein